MAKKKGVEEKDMIEVIEDDEVEYEDTQPKASTKAPPKEDTSKSTDWIDQIKDEDTSPDSILNLVQGVGSAAIKQALSQNDALSVAVELKDVIKTLSTTAGQQKRAQAEEAKGQGAKEIALAIAENNKGLKSRKRIDQSVDSGSSTEVVKENPAKKAKPNFGSIIPDYETSQDIVAPDYKELERVEKELNDKARENAVNKKNS